jgi:hypothetical protein
VHSRKTSRSTRASRTRTSPPTWTSATRDTGIWSRRQDAFPPELPGFTELRASPDGHLWAKRFVVPGLTEALNRWGVFAPVGVFLGNVELPARFRVFDVGDDYLLGVIPDELDVERVHLYRIERR